MVLARVGVEAVKADTPGRARSMVTPSASNAAWGPLLPAASDTEFAARRATTVPSPHPVTVTSMLVPLAAAGEKTQPVAEPAFSKSAAARPLTGSEKDSV